MSIARRTVYYHNKNGNLAFIDWCLVQTSLGAMVEPLNLNRFNNDGTDFDPTDEISLMTEIKEMDYNKLMGLFPFRDGQTTLHGGLLNGRTGF